MGWHAIRPSRKQSSYIANNNDYYIVSYPRLVVVVPLLAGQPILSVGLMHRTDLPGPPSSGLSSDSSFHDGNIDLGASSISLLILLADGSLEIYPSVDVRLWCYYITLPPPKPYHFEKVV